MLVTFTVQKIMAVGYLALRKFLFFVGKKLSCSKAQNFRRRLKVDIFMPLEIFPFRKNKKEGSLIEFSVHNTA